jgi:hypothetical protein
LGEVFGEKELTTGVPMKTTAHSLIGSVPGFTFTSHKFVAKTRTRTNTNPIGTEANAAGKIVRAYVARESKRENS